MNQTHTENTVPAVPERDKQGAEDLWQRHKAQQGVWSSKMLEALARGVKGNRWFSLIDKVYAEATLVKAWEKVKSNAGACGVDRASVEHFDKDSLNRLLAVKEQLKEGSYQPQAIKRVWIPKLGSRDKRPLGIPTVRDRVVQTALRMVIEPIFEKEFAPHSYGFRPGRGCKEALREVNRLLREGYHQIVDIDIEKYFDSIPQDQLMKKVEEKISDGEVLKLIKAFLKQKVMEGTESGEAQEGTPQGGVISPLLANIYLNDLDWKMAQQGHRIVRYADDMVVMCQTPEQAREALESIEQWMDEAGLKLHPLKTRIVDMTVAGNAFEFLGYKFHRSQKGRIWPYARKKSVQKLQERLRGFTRRNNGQSLKEVCETLNPILNGWLEYFQHSRLGSLREVDQWVRQRLRAILRKRHKFKGHVNIQDYIRWPNRYFGDLGLLCLTEEQENRSRLYYRAKHYPESRMR